MSKDGQTAGSENHSEERVKFGEEGFGLPLSWNNGKDTASRNRLRNQATESLGEKPND